MRQLLPPRRRRAPENVLRQRRPCSAIRLARLATWRLRSRLLRQRGPAAWEARAHGGIRGSRGRAVASVARDSRSAALDRLYASMAAPRSHAVPQRLDGVVRQRCRHGGSRGSRMAHVPRRQRTAGGRHRMPLEPRRTVCQVRPVLRPSASGRPIGLHSGARWRRPFRRCPMIDREKRVDALCGCGWGMLAIPETDVPPSCPLCGFPFHAEDPDS